VFATFVWPDDVIVTSDPPRKPSVVEPQLDSSSSSSEKLSDGSRNMDDPSARGHGISLPVDVLIRMSGRHGTLVTASDWLKRNQLIGQNNGLNSIINQSSNQSVSKSINQSNLVYPTDKFNRWGTVHKVRHARGGSRRCDSLWQGKGCKDIWQF